MTTMKMLPRLFGVLALTAPLAAFAAEPAPAPAAPAQVIAGAASAPKAAALPQSPKVATPMQAKAGPDFAAVGAKLDQARADLSQHHVGAARSLLTEAKSSLLHARKSAAAADHARIDATVRDIKETLVQLHRRNHQEAIVRLDAALTQVKTTPAVPSSPSRS